MSRPLRIGFPGAVYHVTSRGDRREPIFVDDTDRRALLEVVAQAMQRFDAEVLAYCLMENHYHFVLHTHQANLSLLMRQINGVYTQAFDRRHAKVGHLFQGRFKAVLVDRDAYLLAVCRYVELNPVRAGIVSTPDAWLDSAGLHGQPCSICPASQRVAVACPTCAASSKAISTLTSSRARIRRLRRPSGHRWRCWSPGRLVRKAAGNHPPPGFQAPGILGQNCRSHPCRLG